MEVEKEKNVHTYLSNIFYYFFVITVAAIFVLSLTLEGASTLEILLNILTILLIVVSIVITFYLAYQTWQYNLTVRKKVQLGLFLITFGFLLILCSVIRQISFGENSLNTLLGGTRFVYWGIGTVLVGTLFELTFLDQVIWELIKKPLKFLWRAIVSLFRWFKTHWKNIVLYSLDIVSLALIIYISIKYDTSIWQIILLSVGCVYPVVHHHRRIWRAVRYFAVNVIYRIMCEVAVLFKRFFVFIWDTLVSFYRFIIKHWWTILKELLRIGAIVGVIIVILWWQPNWIAGWIIFSIIILQTLTRKFILRTIYRAMKFVFRKMAEFFKKYWRRILEESIRFIFFALGITIVVLTSLEIWFLIQYYYYIIGAGVVLVTQVFSRIEVWRFIVKHKKGSVRITGLLLVILGVVLEFTIEEYGEWLPLTASLIAVGAFMFVFARIIVEPVLLINFLKKVVKIIKQVAIAIYNFFKKHWWIWLIEFMRLSVIVALSVIFWIFLETTYYAGWVILFIVVFQTLTRIYILRSIGRFFKQVGLLLKDFLIWLSRPIRYLWRVFVNILRFIKQNWLNVLLYTLDFVAVALIIYSSIKLSKDFQWWFAVILAASVMYIPIHHYRTVWKIVRFIGVDIFYRFFKATYNLIERILTGIWNSLVALTNFIKEHWWSILKEFLRLVGAAIGVWFILIFAEKGGRGINFGVVTNHLIWIGIILIVFSLLFSRKAVLKYMYNALKLVVKTLFKHRVIIFRILGAAAVIYGLVIGFTKSWNVATILCITIGGAFLLFGHWIFHPKRFWEFLKKIPRVIKKILDSIWLTIKTFVTYVFDNFIWLVLLLTVLGSAAYGISLIIGVDFLRTPIDDLAHGMKAGIGGGLILLMVVAFLLLQRQFKKLRTGSTRELARKIKERWQE